METWLAGPLVRFYPRSPALPSKDVTLEAARGERLAFQALFRSGAQPLSVEASVERFPPLDVTIRRVGYVAMPHLSTETPAAELEGLDYLPGYVPDPLYPEAVVHAGPYETHAFWITVKVPVDAEPGHYPIEVTLTSAGKATSTLTAALKVHAGVLSPRRDFPVTQWIYADALCDWYNVHHWDERFWSLLDAYLADYAEHGGDTIYVPMFVPPLEAPRGPVQLLGVHREAERYTFDWKLVRRWVHAAQAQGITHFEWTHLFSQWGARNALPVLEGFGEGAKRLWPAETGASSEVYRQFLAQFLPAFERMLRDEGLLERSFFHVSDEPHGDEQLGNYRAARELLRELAPWMKVMDALSDIRFAREGLVDIPVPLLTTAPEFVQEDIPAWAYFCCVPRGLYLNRMFDTPLVKIRMSGWLFYRLRARGFLHWGYNFWYESRTTNLIDPYAVADGVQWPAWGSGDPFLVYPGADGPIDSVRWEVFAQSMQDYALLQASGARPEDPDLALIRDYADFPRDADWIEGRRRALLARLDENGGQGVAHHTEGA